MYVERETKIFLYKDQILYKDFLNNEDEEIQPYKNDYVDSQYIK